MNYTAEDVAHWVDQWPSKRSAAEAIGVARKTLYAMLERGASLTQTLAMMMAAQIKENTMTTIDTITGIDTITTSTATLEADGWELPDDVKARDLVRLTATERGWRWQIQEACDGWQTLSDEIASDDVAHTFGDVACAEDVEEALMACGGFACWAWDMREETLAQLRDGELEPIAHELSEVLDAVRRQQDTIPRWGHLPAAREYLEEHRRDLIAEIERFAGESDDE